MEQLKMKIELELIANYETQLPECDTMALLEVATITLIQQLAKLVLPTH